MSYFKISDGRWVVKFPAGTIPDDPDRVKIYCGRGIEGETKAKQLNQDFNLEKKRERIGPAFKSLAAAYIRSRNSDMARSTLTATVYCFDSHILPFFGSVNAYRIDADLLDRYVRERKKPQKKKSTKNPDGTWNYKFIDIKNVTIHRELSIVKAVMSWSHGRGLIAGNNIAGYKLPKRDDRIQTPPSPAELSAIIENAAPHLKRAILVAFYTGLRPGRSELLSLEWSDVNFADNVIYIESAKKGGIESRVVPLNPVLLKNLREWHREDLAAETKLNSVSVSKYKNIINYKGKKVGSLKTAWREAKRRAQITRTLKLYTLRHAATFSLLAAGNDARTVSSITGNTLEMLLSKYFQSSNDLKVQAVDGMPDITKKGPDTLGPFGTKKLRLLQK